MSSYTKEELENMLEDVVNVLDLSNGMIEHKEEALTYNSPNLWGTYPNAFRFLCTCAIACAEYPDWYFYIAC